jgi:hypothetical protein
VQAFRGDERQPAGEDFRKASETPEEMDGRNSTTLRAWFRRTCRNAKTDH